MPGIELIRSFLQQASAQGSRSTALNPLGWAMTIIFSAMIGAGVAHMPTWVLVMLGVFESFAVAAYLIAYFFLLVKDRDALRSERFQLSKMAIERSIAGDNLAGFIDPEKQAVALPPVKSESGE
jgi:hypothetical protein